MIKCSGLLSESIFGPSAKRGTCARSSVVEMAGKISARIQQMTSKPRHDSGVKSKSRPRPHTTQADTDPQAIRSQIRLSVSSTALHSKSQKLFHVTTNRASSKVGRSCMAGHIESSVRQTRNRAGSRRGGDCTGAKSSRGRMGCGQAPAVQLSYRE